jgi:hypothetical protein
MFTEDQKKYLEKIRGAAVIGSQKTGIPAELIAAWWTWETAYGTNRTSKVNNHAGIKNLSTGKDYSDGQYAAYNTIENFANDWARIISGNRAGYPEIIAAARGKKSYIDITDAHNKSLWSEADYNLLTIDKRAKNIAMLYKIPAQPSKPNDVNNLSQDDLKKYAAIGLAVLAAIALVKS